MQRRTQMWECMKFIQRLENRPVWNWYVCGGGVIIIILVVIDNLYWVLTVCQAPFCTLIRINYLILTTTLLSRQGQEHEFEAIACKGIYRLRSEVMLFF